MKKILVLAAVLALASGVAYANFCARDYVPAATLLVPYAVVDLDANSVPNPAGYTTLLAVTNVSNTKQLIHVVVWDAQSNGIVDFDEVLSGYDVWTINFRDLLNGNFNLFDTGDPDKTDNGSNIKPPNQPQVGDFVKGTTFSIGAQPWGPYTNQPYLTNLPIQQDIDFATPANTNCNFPYGNLASYGPTITGLLEAAIVPVGQDSSACRTATVASPPYLSNLTSKPVFFYVTVDVVTACNQNFPNDAAYWSPAVFPTTNNVLIGDIIYLNSTSNFSESYPAVSIEADLDWASATHHGFYSRYSQYVGGPAPAVNDFHEPLGTAFGFRYYNAGGVSTNLMVWKNNMPWRDEFYRDKNGVPVDADACISYIYYAFDENENSKARGGGGPSGFNTAEPNILPYETQKAPLDVTNWNGLMANNGWMLLVFDPSIIGPANFLPTEGIQAWVGVQYYFAGYSTALEAATLGNVWCFPTDVLPVLNTYVGIAGNGLKAAPTAP